MQWIESGYAGVIHVQVIFGFGIREEHQSRLRHAVISEEEFATFEAKIESDVRLKVVWQDWLAMLGHRLENAPSTPSRYPRPKWREATGLSGKIALFGASSESFGRSNIRDLRDGLFDSCRFANLLLRDAITISGGPVINMEEAYSFLEMVGSSAALVDSPRVFVDPIIEHRTSATRP